jgi:calcineurin-like phosphoesterase family protein
MRLKLDHQNLFFISDAHFGHANVIKYDNRPFSDVEEMNHTLIENWNELVGVNDTVIYMGDFCFDRSGGLAKSIADQLNGKIHFVLGNHDNEKDIRKLNRFESVSDYINLSVLDTDNPRKKQGIMIMHYPILSWDKAHHGDFMLHGHCHGSLVNNPEYSWYYKRKVIDVGCNMTNYRPISYSEVKEIMSKKENSEHH